MYIILTENQFLYKGIESILGENLCVHQKTRSKFTYTHITKNRITLIIDCDIFTVGEWSVYDDIHKFSNDIHRIWLKQKNTGNIFPEGCDGDVYTHATSGLGTIINSLHFNKVTKCNCIDIKNINKVMISRKEKRLLTYILAGYSIHFLSREFKCSEKTLYNHQKNILSKTGFKSMHSLCQQFMLNPKLITEITKHVI